MKPAIDKTTSKEKFNLVGLDDSFPKQTSGIIGEICICANYKLLYDLQQESPTPDLWPVRNQATEQKVSNGRGREA